MPALLESCEHFFGSQNLYKVLKIDKTATVIEVKKAYKKLSLIVHPDRVGEEDKEEATEKFKVLGKIHSVLSDGEKRAIYDETGCVDEEDDPTMQDRDWSSYWRCLFKEITIDDIREYETQYKGSKEEIQDLKYAYEKGKGDIDVIFQYVPFTTLKEEPRIKEVLEKLIKEKEIPEYEEFTHEDPRKKLRRKRRLEKEEKLIENSKKSKNDEEELLDGGLMNAILKKRKDREAKADDFFKHLTAKYGNKPKSRKQKNKK